MHTNPTTIITGFLGAGKTTYLNSILDKYAEIKFAIIENELGEKSIDSDLILRGEENVMELNNGCLCCTINDGLYEILGQLYKRRNDFQELIIEATGVADPRGLANPFLTNPSIKKQFPLRQIICLVDAALIEQQLEVTEEAIHQITFSDLILINKTDLVDEHQLKRVETLLKKLNPLSKILIGNKDNFPAIQNDFLQVTDGIKQVEQVEQEEFLITKTAPPNHKHTKGIKSFTLNIEKPFDYKKLHLRLLTFLIFQSKHLFRMKGVICLQDSEEKYVLQAVGKQLTLEPFGKRKEGEKKWSKIVIIGKDFKKEALQKMFEQGT